MMSVAFLARHLLLLGRNGSRAGYAFSARLTSNSNVPDNSSGEKPKVDSVTYALKSAYSQADVLKIAGIHWRHMEPFHLILSFRTLQDLQKKSGSEMIVEDISRSNEFILLCKSLRRQIRLLGTNELLDAIKAVTFFNIHPKSALVQGLLHMIKNDVNSLSIPQIIFLSFLLQKYPKDSVVDALKIALPIVFEANLAMKLERKNVSMLVDSLIFCSKNQVSNQSINTVISAFIELDQLEWLTMDPKRARNIVIAIAEIGLDWPQCEALFKDASLVFLKSLDQFSFIEIERFVECATRSSKRVPYLLDADLLEAISEVGLKLNWSLIECCILLRKLMRTGVISKNLLNYLGSKVLDDPEEFRDAKFGTIKSFIGGMSVANYKTVHWNVLKDLIPTSTCFQMVKPTEPWMALCLELASLDIYCHNLLSEVFDPSFLKAYLAREFNILDLIQMLRLYQAVNALHPEYKGPFPPEELLQEAMALNGLNTLEFPLKRVLQLGMGGDDYVLTKCFADYGYFIDHVVVLRQGGHAVAFPNMADADKVELNQLNLPADSLKVAIRFLPPSMYNSYKQLKGTAVLGQRVLESQGFAVVNISQEGWKEMPDWEKSPYLLQQIRLNSQQVYSENQSILE